MIVLSAIYMICPVQFVYLCQKRKSDFQMLISCHLTTHKIGNLFYAINNNILFNFNKNVSEKFNLTQSYKDFIATMPFLTSVIFDPYLKPPEFDLVMSLVSPEVSRRSKTSLNKAHLKTISIILDESVDVQNVVNDLLFPKTGEKRKNCKKCLQDIAATENKSKKAKLPKKNSMSEVWTSFLPNNTCYIFVPIIS